jgi:hypothetical protein
MMLLNIAYIAKLPKTENGTSDAHKQILPAMIQMKAEMDQALMKDKLKTDAIANLDTEEMLLVTIVKHATALDVQIANG